MRFLSESRDGSLAKGAFSKLRCFKMVRIGALGRLVRCSEGHLGALGPLLGGSWGALGALMERSWALLGCSLALVGAPGSPLGGFGSIFDPPRVDFVRLGKHFRPSEDRLECELETGCD